MATERKAHKMVITLDNVLPADAIALKKMFEYMQTLGNVGSSRWCCFFADGDGSFHPKVSIEYPMELPEVPEIDGEVEYNKETRKLEGNPIHSDGDFAIDSNSIAWKIYHDPEPEDYVRPKNPLEDALNLKDDGNTR